MTPPLPRSFASIKSKVTQIFYFCTQNDDKVFVTGTVSGLITVQKRADHTELPQKTPVSHRYAGDISTRNSNAVDLQVTLSRKDKLASYDYAFRKFQYAKALDCVLVAQIAYKSPSTVITVFDELIRLVAISRGGKFFELCSFLCIIWFFFYLSHVGGKD